MRVFISWSGEKSKQVAILLEEWIKCVIQASSPWMSTNIERGALWFSEINEQLSTVSLGIICLTSENKEKPWILFEAGALAKGLQTNRVCTLLIDLKNEEVDQPLAQFNHTIPNKAGMWQLINTINLQLGDNKLSQNILEKVFEKNWSDFDDRFKSILEMPAEVKTKSTKRESDDILFEILNTVRTFDRRIEKIEINSKPDSDPKEREHKFQSELSIQKQLIDKELIEVINKFNKSLKIKNDLSEEPKR